MVVIAGKPGQLGNMLLLSAHFIAGALEHGYRVAIPAFDAYAAHFVGTRRDVFCRFPSRATPLSGSARTRHVLFSLSHAAARALTRLGDDWGPMRAVTLGDWTTVFPLDQSWFIEAARSRLVFVRGWLFRDSTTLAKHAQAVRDFFQPLETYRATVAGLIEEARKGADVLVGVHVRQGYRTLPEHSRYWYSPEQYVALMHKVEALFPGRRVTFLLCSDETPERGRFAGLRVVFGHGHLIEDLYSLAECDYLVGPPSTFGMWASFHGGVPLYTVTDPLRDPTLAQFQPAVL
jgi:hypothetical protein